MVLAVVICVTYVGLATSRVTVFKSKYLGVTDVDRSASGQSRPRPPGTSGYLSPEAQAARRNAVVLPNMSERLVYWRYFAGASTTDARTFLTGHAEQPDIRDYPSAHNYYLDYLYNFGFLALVPLLVVFVITVRDVWRVQYFNSMQTLILDTLEVVDVPEVALAAPEDLADSKERLGELVQWMSESCARQAGAS